jgi:hypothetical protein
MFSLGNPTLEHNNRNKVKLWIGILYLLKQLRRAGVDKKHLIGFYNACIRSILEYACEVFHSSLPTYLSDDLERVQRRAMPMRIFFSWNEV